MIFSVDAKQLALATATLDRFTAELRRLNDNLEAGRTSTTPAGAARDSAARPAAPSEPR